MFLHNPKKPPSDSLSKIEKRMAWCNAHLIVRFRFVHEILSITRRIQTDIDTMGVRAVGGMFELRYNPSLVGLDTLEVPGLSNEELSFIYTHEVLHMTLHHCTSRQFDNIEIGSLAKDAAVNELIPDCVDLQRPRDKDGNLVGIFVSEMVKQKEFSDIQRKQSAEWYYSYFMKKVKQHSIRIISKNNNTVKISVKSPDGDEKVYTIQIHEAKQDEIASERIRAKVHEINQQGLWNKAWGDSTSGIVELIMAAQQRRINWQNHVRRFYGNLVWSIKETTRKRPNRRTGILHPGSKRIHLDKHLVGVDDSGSITDKMLSGFLGIVNSFLDYFPIDMMVFDSQRQQGPLPYAKKRFSFSFKGRGGTSFQPLFDIARERKYRSLVILTDGEAAAPSKPKNLDVLWVLPAGKEPPVDWGKRVHIGDF